MISLVVFGVAGGAVAQEDIPTGMLLVSNRLRISNKQPAQDLSIKLSRAAQDQANYMAAKHNDGNEDFNHINDTGTPGHRAAEHNYRGIVIENIARSYDSIEEVFAAWRNSPSHWSAITSETVEVGFGFATAADGTTYWVALYGKPPKFRLISESSTTITLR